MSDLDVVYSRAHIHGPLHMKPSWGCGGRRCCAAWRPAVLPPVSSLKSLEQWKEAPPHPPRSPESLWPGGQIQNQDTWCRKRTIHTDFLIHQLMYIFTIFCFANRIMGIFWLIIRFKIVFNCSQEWVQYSSSNSQEPVEWWIFQMFLSLTQLSLHSLRPPCNRGPLKRVSSPAIKKKEEEIKNKRREWMNSSEGGKGQRVTNSFYSQCSTAANTNNLEGWEYEFKLFWPKRLRRWGRVKLPLKPGDL